jgi:hypothetical protein
MLGKDIFDSGHLGYQQELFFVVSIFKKDATFFTKCFLTKILMFLSKNGILQSAERFCKVDLDS